MSRRPPAAATAASTAEANKVRLKTLVKLESNKACADCKRNKHPRWASWNLGVFVCIRCSGIHRGLGTHISRVKSVDLDSWTDEQTANMIRWGNGRANKYWESKLAEGHVPNESKIENFIRTKYDSKRWVMDGPMPDPSTLDDGSSNDDVPLSVVKEEIKRTASQRNGSMPQQRRQEVDLFGDLESSAPVPARPSTTEPAVSRPPGPPKAPAAPPKQTKPGDSLLGLDFFGGPQSAQPARPSSTGGSTPGAPGRADLKSSILSLYASKPAPPPQQTQQHHSNVSAFGGMQAAPLASPTQPPSNSQSFGGMNDAFSSLSFGQSPPAQQAKPSPFAGLTSPTGHTRQASSASKPAMSGGSFFDMKSAQPSQSMSPPSQPAAAPAPRKESFGGDWGDFSSAAASPPAPVSAMKSPPAASSSMGDLFDMGSPVQSSAPAAAPAPPPKPATQQPPPINYSAFNLSQPAPQPPKPAQPAQTSTSAFGALNSTDAWGSNDAWATPDPAPAPPQPPKQTAASFSPPKQPAPVQTSAFDSGWGDMTSPSENRPAANTSSGFSVQQDDDFGGWSHASPVATTPGAKTSGGGGGGGGMGGGSTDLFDNPW